MTDFGSFLFADRDYFEPIDRYQRASVYEDRLLNLLPQGWITARHSIWFGADPAGMAMRQQGFKIHISATTRTAADVLDRVVPELGYRGIPFKIAGDPRLLAYLTSKRCGRGNSGKFITVYPPSDEVFVDLIEALHQCTRHLDGPYILSDRRYRDSRVVFYRYGGFAPSWTLGVDGTRSYVLQGPTGESVADERTPFFTVPPWVRDPLNPDAVTAMDEAGADTLTLGNRFAVQRALAFSNTGGVYVALDTATSETVIVKEARPLTGCWETDGGFIDAVDILRREYDTLCRLSGVAAVPRAIATFKEWEHTFLVESLVVGMPLRNYRALDDVILVSHLHEPARVREFLERFRYIARQLLQVVDQVHAAGIVIGDLSPNNVLIDPTTTAVGLIDLESAITAEERTDETMIAFARQWYTPGFRQRAANRQEPVCFADDYFAVGMVLFSLLTAVEVLCERVPEAVSRFLDRFARAGVPQEVSGVIMALLDARPERARDLLAAEWRAV